MIVAPPDFKTLFPDVTEYRSADLAQYVRSQRRRRLGEKEVQNRAEGCKKLMRRLEATARCSNCKSSSVVCWKRFSDWETVQPLKNALEDMWPVKFLASLVRYYHPLCVFCVNTMWGNAHSKIFGLNSRAKKLESKLFKETGRAHQAKVFWELYEAWQDLFKEVVKRPDLIDKKDLFLPPEWIALLP